jgi:hypothetical protein
MLYLTEAQREERKAQSSMKRGLLILPLALVVWACADSTAPPTFQITATVDRASTTVGDSVNFTIKAQGSLLVNLGVDYADGSEGYARDLGGATTVTANLRHAFLAVGNYNVTAVVFTASGDNRMANVTVQVH